MHRDKHNKLLKSIGRIRFFELSTRLDRHLFVSEISRGGTSEPRSSSKTKAGVNLPPVKLEDNTIRMSELTEP
ncbi:hypothetical protein Cflav_PD4243 [Pedosphaera parvula Ellin514]|uniref:Uncharacterized protein n=1 Tax=Pedosphaera parvula (strain Ellin514) TaxID=320771 RepID=B9XF67_PEDPL|nr:hypothetical protein Cflav_PD4243 [Pedosphaera parvula Ellin514]